MGLLLPHSFVLFVLVQVHIAVELFLDSCPAKPMWNLRGKNLCGDKDKYMCLYDRNKRKFRELCKDKPEFHRSGYIFIISGNLQYFDGRPCKSNKYQPHIWWTNGSSGCQYLKSICNGEGQVPYDNGNITSDRKCRCDYTHYYTFLNSTMNRCYCDPEEEDCSCYKKKCDEDEVLTPDYDCVGTHEWTGQFVCPEYKPSKIPDEREAGTATCPTIRKDSSGTGQPSFYLAYTVICIAIVILGLMIRTVFFFQDSSQKRSEKIKEVTPIVEEIFKSGIPEREGLQDKKKIIEENTEKRIKKHKSDKTFYLTTAIKKGTRLLDSINVLVLLGTEKCGKTKACLSLCNCFKDKGFAIIYISSSDKEEVKNISYYIDNDKNQIYVFDINVTPTEEDAIKELINVANLHANENIKFIFTVKTSAVTKFLDDFPAEQQVEIDFLNEDDKRGILKNHMKHNNIVVCKSYQKANYEYPEKLKQDEKIKIPMKVIDDITKAETTGPFPHLCKSFCSTRSLLPFEDRYFKNPPQSLIDAICEFRSEDEVLYVTLAYILMEDALGNEVNMTTINAICSNMERAKDKYSQYQIKDAAKKLKNKYTYLKEKVGLFMFSSDILKKAVWISHIDIDAEYCVMNCQWEYVTDLLRPRNWPVHDKDVCIAVKVFQLTSRLISEMDGSAWSVGTYLRKLSEKGKELTDNFCDCMKTKDLKSKTDIILSFLNGITDFGSYTNVFNFSESITDFVMWPHLDKNNNSILHFCIIQNVEFICNDISIELREAFINMKNKKKYSPCALAFYFGRSNILLKHAELIPEEYEYYRVFKYMTSHGEKHAGKNISPTDLNFVSLDLPLNSVENVKFGKRQEYFTINRILVALKNITMVLIRIQGLPSKVKYKDVKDTLSSNGCDVFNVYQEKYREKGDLTDINTGDLIAVCKFTNKSLPSELTIREDNVTTETMVRIKIFKLPSYVRDYQIDNALSLQKCTVKELYPEIKQTTGDKFIDYIAVCTPMENTLPEQIDIDQYRCYTSVMTTIRFKSLPKEINASEIENLLKRHHFDVDNTYREKRRKEGKLTNIKTGDRIAICKPFAHQLPSSLAFGNFQERYKIQRE